MANDSSDEGGTTSDSADRSARIGQFVREYEATEPRYGAFTSACAEVVKRLLDVQGIRHHSVTCRPRAVGSLRYAEFFESRGVGAVTARDGEEAVAPHVIVMDLAMPGLDGIAATRRLKQRPRTRRIPVILLTGYALRTTDRGALEAGVDVVLRKPCLPDELEDHVRRLLDRRADRS